MTAFTSGDSFAVFCLGWARLGHYIPRIAKERAESVMVVAQLTEEFLNACAKEAK